VHNTGRCQVLRKIWVAKISRNQSGWKLVA
jgi:hypothetical protein